VAHPVGDGLLRAFFFAPAWTPLEGIDINLSTGRTKQLSPRDRRYIKYRFGPLRMSQRDAFLAAVQRPDGTYPCKAESARQQGSRLEQRLRRNPALWSDIMAACELDDYTLAEGINWALKAKRSEFYQGALVAEVEDNGTRMRAIELIAELLGHRKQAVELAGTLGLKGYIGWSPDEWDKAHPPEGPKDGERG